MCCTIAQRWDQDGPGPPGQNSSAAAAGSANPVLHEISADLGMASRARSPVQGSQCGRPKVGLRICCF